MGFTHLGFIGRCLQGFRRSGGSWALRIPFLSLPIRDLGGFRCVGVAGSRLWRFSGSGVGAFLLQGSMPIRVVALHSCKG